MLNLTGGRRLRRYTRRKDASARVFALGKVPIEECGLTNKKAMSHAGKRVDVQITGIIWDLNFSMKAGKTAEYDISVAFIRRGDKNALGELIHEFKPQREYLIVRESASLTWTQKPSPMW